MPRGGRRVGAGRKPKAKGPGVIIGMDGRRQDRPLFPGATEQDPDEVDLLVPPTDLGLTAEARRYWRKAAPDAIAQGTLVPSARLGFAELCELQDLKQKLLKRIHRLGPASATASSLLKDYTKLSLQVGTTLARFKLTGDGKPAQKDPQAGAANPWEAVGR